MSTWHKMAQQGLSPPPLTQNMYDQIFLDRQDERGVWKGSRDGLNDHVVTSRTKDRRTVYIL